MCLFTNDIYSECKHVECNLIKVIQMQNANIFTQANNNNFNMEMNVQPHNYEIHQKINGQSNNQRFSNKQHQHMEGQHQHVQQVKIKQEVKQHCMNIEYKGLNNLHSVVNIASENHPQSYHQKKSKSPTKRSQSSIRISLLEQQVKILKNGMKTLVNNLRQRNVLSDEEYKMQCQFLKQVQMIEKQSNNVEKVENYQQN